MWLSGIVCTLLFLILDKFMWLRSHGIVCQSRFVIEYFNLIWFERCAMLLHFFKKINSWFYTYFVGDEIEFVLLYKMNCSHCIRNYLSCHEITKKTMFVFYCPHFEHWDGRYLPTDTSKRALLILKICTIPLFSLSLDLYFDHSG